MNLQKEFPIMGGFIQGRNVPYSGIPWSMIEPHERQALLNHDQTLERLAQRGGLSYSEACAVLEDRRWHKMSIDDAMKQLDEKLNVFLNGRTSYDGVQSPPN